MKDIGNPEKIAEEINRNKKVSTFDLIRLKSTWKLALQYSLWFTLIFCASIVILLGFVYVLSWLHMIFRISLYSQALYSSGIGELVDNVGYFIPGILSLYIGTRIFIKKKLSKSNYPRQTLISLVLATFPFSLGLSAYLIRGIGVSPYVGGTALNFVMSLVVYEVIALLLVLLIDKIMYRYEEISHQKKKCADEGIVASFTTMLVISVLVVGGMMAMVKGVWFVNGKLYEKS